jgi:hypothetical protein
VYKSWSESSQGRVDERRRVGLLTLEEVELNLVGWMVFHFEEHLWMMDDGETRRNGRVRARENTH